MTIVSFFYKTLHICCQTSENLFLDFVIDVELLTTKERFHVQKSIAVARGKVEVVRRAVKQVPANVQ